MTMTYFTVAPCEYDAMDPLNMYLLVIMHL